jgi:protein-S-isoprenylcysteine O-methyltransferase Ste14
MTIDVTPTEILAGVGVLLGLFVLWRGSVRRARAAADAARAGVRVVSLAGRVLVTAGVIVGVQWLVIRHPLNTTVLLVVLAVPALFAAHSITRALTVTTLDTPRRRGERR